eukprot:TRINITY_DN14030_c0_g1_i1.p1 TRINITY_DN14030_c0_g1~~TRINITY_DN14030_c0_g1_i1.p1  ORF type:complete len:394 (+),score=149.28 TRINITY_DN14030_c0_g1_i1:81-1184(+)
MAHVVSFDLERAPPQALLEEQADRLEARLREHILAKYGFDDLRRPKEALRRLFRDFDEDGSGRVAFPEFRKAMSYMHIADQDRAVEALFDRYDRDDSGTLSYSEFSDGIWGFVPIPGAAPQCRELIATVRSALRNSAAGQRGLTRAFRRMDGNGNKKLERSEMAAGLAEVGVELTPDELEMVMVFFDYDGDGTVSATEFLRQVRGKMNHWRRQLVEMAYRELDPNGDGELTLAEAKQLFNSQQHPAVVSGERTQEEVLADFIAAWDKDGDGALSLDEFLDYYKDVSTQVEDDKEFEALVRGTWCIPESRRKRGARGTTAVVYFSDGSQTEVEVPSGSGVDTQSVRSVETSLRKQGMQDIYKVSLRHT